MDRTNLGEEIVERLGIRQDEGSAVKEANSFFVDGLVDLQDSRHQCSLFEVVLQRLQPTAAPGFLMAPCSTSFLLEGSSSKVEVPDGHALGDVQAGTRLGDDIVARDISQCQLVDLVPQFRGQRQEWEDLLPWERLLRDLGD